MKAITLLANILLRQQAVDQKCQETFLIRDGQVTEGTASNIFIIRDGTVLTPPKSPLLLPGITRDVILEIAENTGFPYQEKNISVDELFTADEVWFTSSTREIVPVISVDNRQIGTGVPGEVWRQFIAEYGRYKEQLIAGNM